MFAELGGEGFTGRADGGREGVAGREGGEEFDGLPQVFGVGLV